MRAVVFDAFGESDVLAMADVPEPAPPGPGRVTVDVRAVEVSRTRDVATRSGRHPFSQQVPALPHVLGGDFSGVVRAVGEGVEEAWVGRRVAVLGPSSCGACPACDAGREPECPQLALLGIHRWGSYAERADVPVANLVALPDDIGFPEAAALAANAPVAAAQLHRSGLGPGTWTLVTGVSGALGSILAAVASGRGARVVGLSRHPERVAETLGLAAVLEPGDGLTEALDEITGGAGIEVVLDNVASPEAFTGYFPALAIGARIVISGALGFPLPVLPVPAAPLYVRSISLLGIRTGTPRDWGAFWSVVEGGFRLPAGLVRTRPLEEAAAAQDDVVAGRGAAHTVLEL